MNPLNKISYGLFIITTTDGKTDNGCIVNTVCQVADNPKRISVCVNNNNYTCDLIKSSKIFNVSVLTEQTPFYVFEHFGFKSGREFNKFEKHDNVFRSENGVYVVPKFANSYISGKVVDMFDLGSHTMFVAEVTAGYVFNEEPSITYAYYHANTKPKPSNTEKKGYRCEICGYVYEGETLPEDYICPICKHGADAFVKINN